MPFAVSYIHKNNFQIKEFKNISHSPVTKKMPWNPAFQSLKICTSQGNVNFADRVRVTLSRVALGFWLISSLLLEIKLGQMRENQKPKKFFEGNTSGTVFLSLCLLCSFVSERKNANGQKLGIEDNFHTIQGTLNQHPGLNTNLILFRGF